MMLRRAGPGKAWTFLGTTPKVEKWLGSRGRVAVTGMVNGYTFRNYFAPLGDGTHAMMFRREYQTGAGVKPGEEIKVTLEHDDAPRTVEVPPDLAKALSGNAKARAFFAELSYTHQKEYATWITDAKQPETRARRLAEAVKLMTKGIKWEFRPKGKS